MAIETVQFPSKMAIETDMAGEQKNRRALAEVVDGMCRINIKEHVFP